jgi:energy-coupling factor transport system permease protein
MYPVMLILILVIWPFFYPKGEVVLVNWAFVHITLDGVWFALAQCLRIAVAITGCLFFVMVTEIIDLSSVLGRFLQRLHISYTVPFMLTTSFKFLPEFMSSYATIKESFVTRGFQLDKGNFVQKLKNFIPLFIPLIDTSLGKAQSIASAMLQRAFGAKKKRTFYTVYGFGFNDVLFAILSLGMLGFAIYGQIVKLGGFDLHL